MVVHTDGGAHTPAVLLSTRSLCPPETSRVHRSVHFIHQVKSVFEHSHLVLPQYTFVFWYTLSAHILYVIEHLTSEDELHHTSIQCCVFVCAYFVCVCVCVLMTVFVCVLVYV